MRRRDLILVLFVTACGRMEQPPAEARRRWMVSPDGIGPIRVGTPLAALAQQVGQALPRPRDDGEACGYVWPAGVPDGVALMVYEDTVVRVDVDSPGVPTAEGAEVDDDEQSVLRRYAGRVRVSPHPYDGPEGHYLTVSAPGDTSRLLIFETDGRRVTRYRAGLRPAVEWIEGCL